jgi:hypothetical protein
VALVGRLQQRRFSSLRTMEVHQATNQRLSRNHTQTHT